MKNNILITGGAGYIGSHIVQSLLNTVNKITVVDNLSRSTINNINILNKKFKTKVPFYNLDISNTKEMDKIFKKYKFDLVIHLAGFKSIIESINNPSLYRTNNFISTQKLVDVMLKNDCRKIIFSSSASVYGYPEYLPIDEKHPINPLNPYSKSKADIEFFLAKLVKNYDDLKCIILRYFNPVGSFQGFIGEDLTYDPTILMPAIIKAALKIKDRVIIFGNNFNTHDGTGIRDYIHVDDLANAHTASIELINNLNGINTYNIGCGRGYSVLEMIETFKDVNKLDVPYIYSSRRPGDVDKIYADISKFKACVDWKAKKDIKDMCMDAWKYETYKK